MGILILQAMTNIPGKAWERTLTVLQKTPNEAAVEVLLAGLSSSTRAIQYASMSALLSRRTPKACLSVIEAWEEIPDRIKVLVLEAPEQMSAVLESVFAGTYGDSYLPAACEVVICLRGFGLISAVLGAAERRGAHRTIAAQTLLDLCEQYYDSLSDSTTKRSDRESIHRPHAINHLAIATERKSPSIREIVESLLVISDADTTPLRRILRDRSHAAHEIAIDSLEGNPRTAIIDLLIQFVSDPHAPKPVLRVIAKRTDISYLRAVFRALSGSLSPDIRRNLGQIDSLEWADSSLERVLGLQDEEQYGAVQMMAHCGLGKSRRFELIRTFLEKGAAGGRRAAANALADYHTDEANQLALRALDDIDPEVQASLISQLRERKLPGAMARLIDCLDSPHQIVRKAAQQSLSEFNFKRFIAMFESLSDESRMTTGELVRKADPDAIVELRAEILSNDRARVIRGLQAAIALKLVQNVEDIVIGRLADDDHFVRSEAARAVGYCSSLAARNALREAMLDSSVTVQQAAGDALQKMAAAPPLLTDDPSSIQSPLQDWLR